MTTATTTLSRAQSTRPLITWAGWIWIGVIGLLFGLLHQEFLYRTSLIALSNANWSHALIVPFISLYYIYYKRDQLQRHPPRVCPWGLPILLLGLFCYAFALYPVRNDMIRGYSMILTLFGLVLFLLGPRMMRVLWFPIAYLALAVKISDAPWNNLAWKLQNLASGGATLALKFIAVLMNFGVNDRGTTIDLTFMHHGQMVTQSLNVAEACSGLRMLMAFIALGVAIAFLSDRRWWQKVIISLSTVPIALGVNIARVTVVGVLYTYNQAMATGEFHIFIGMLMLIPAAGAFFLLGWILDRLFIHDPKAAASEPARSTERIEPMGLSQAFRVKDIIVGLIIGALLGLLAGFGYILSLLVIRPDVIHGFPKWLIWPAFVSSLIIVIGIAAGYRWMLPRADNPLRLTRRLNISLAVVAALLLVSFVGQSSVIAATHLVMFKKKLPLRLQLYNVPKTLGSWKQVGEDQILKPSVVEALGTDFYLTRYFVDTSVDQPKVNFDAVQTGSYKPGSVVRMHVAYYTGTPDTVPHVPNRCFVAGGVKPVGTTTVELTLHGKNYVTRHGQLFASSKLALRRYGNSQVRIPSRTITATDFTFAPGHGSNQKSNVIYFFACNGKFLSGPDEVRLEGFSPWDKYGYYCKVSVLLPGIGKRAEAVKRVSAFLSHALPEIMACLPDWYEVKHGLYPPHHAGGDGSGDF